MTMFFTFARPLIHTCIGALALLLASHAQADGWSRTPR
jgi:hypothetical protein